MMVISSLPIDKARYLHLSTFSLNSSEVYNYLVRSNYARVSRGSSV
jgi:hypothetical protein